MKEEDGRKNNGGARKGAGRPKTSEPTVLMRIPVSLVEKVKALIAKRKSDWLKSKNL